jgi:hypothetical protein
MSSRRGVDEMPVSASWQQILAGDSYPRSPPGPASWQDGQRWGGGTYRWWAIQWMRRVRASVSMAGRRA